MSDKKLPTVHKIENPFAMQQSQAGEQNALAHSQGTAIMGAEVQRSIAEVQASYMVAQSCKRNQVQAFDRMINECQRPTLAEQAVYSYPRGGVEVTGPTIRLAEMIARNWGNIKCGWRCLDRKPGRSLIQAFAVDLETNFMDDIVFEVSHVRDTKGGKKALTDERDIYEMEANQAARRLRKCILTIIPGDIIDACLDQCEITLSTTADNSPESIKKLLNAFKPYGVNKAMIESRLGRKIESVSKAQIANFKKIYVSLKDGMSGPADWFDMSLADKEPKDATITEKEPKKRGRPSKAEQEKVADNKASDTEDFKKEQAEKQKAASSETSNQGEKINTPEEKPEPKQEPQPEQDKSEPSYPDSHSCVKCGGSGVISEENDDGEIIEYPCARCS